MDSSAIDSLLASNIRRSRPPPADATRTGCRSLQHIIFLICPHLISSVLVKHLAASQTHTRPHTETHACASGRSHLSACISSTGHISVVGFSPEWCPHSISPSPLVCVRHKHAASNRRRIIVNTMSPSIPTTIPASVQETPGPGLVRLGGSCCCRRWSGCLFRGTSLCMCIYVCFSDCA